jgi:NADH dehydrogenase FAD-containing subunit
MLFLSLCYGVVQVAKQQGEYLAEVLKKSTWDKTENKFVMGPKQQPFKYAAVLE